MRVDESRRLTGLGPLLDGPGAALEAIWEPGDDPEAAIARWTDRVRAVHAALGLGDATMVVRRYGRGASLAFRALPDRLYAATAINEWAVGTGALEAAAPGLAEAIAREASPELLALLDEARLRGVAVLADDDLFTLGHGEHAATWPISALPDPSAVNWAARGRVPVAIVTGTNGKSTTSRLLARCMTMAGLRVGSCTTDEIRIDGALVERGDWTGPGGARRVLRDERVQAAVLETARGGLLRRGLAVDRADVAVVTNIAADHLGDYGIDDVPALGHVKMSVVGAVPPGGWVVLNAEDTTLRTLAATACAGRKVVWFAVHPQVASMARRPGDATVVVREGWIAWVSDDRDVRVLPVADVPVTYGATARFNVENALAAAGAALALGLPPEAVARGLRSLRPDAGDSPGRQNAWNVDGVKVLLDFGHNPHGVNALMEWVARWHPSGERTVLIGQAGDRDEAAIRDLVRATLKGGVTRAVTRPMPGYGRGRDLAEVPRLLARFFLEEGLAPDRVEAAESEANALERALAVSKPGDLIIMLVHVEREPVSALLKARGAVPA